MYYKLVLIHVNNYICLQCFYDSLVFFRVRTQLHQKTSGNSKTFWVCFTKQMKRVTPHFIKRIPETALRSELGNIWRKKCHVTCSSRPMYPLTNASIRLKSFPVRTTEAKVICSDSLIGRGYKISNERGASSMLCLKYYIRPRLQ